MNIVLIHGYSGGPKNFKDLPDYLKTHKVYNLKLPGHTTPKELAKVTYEQFYSWFEKEINKIKNPVLIGYSLGAQLSLRYAMNNKVKALISIAAPIIPKFPFNKLDWIHNIIPYVRHTHFDEERLKDCSFKTVPTIGLKVMNQANKHIKFDTITCPVLAIQNEKDYLSSPSSLEELKTIKHYEETVLKGPVHNPFDRISKKETIAAILKFLDKITLK